MKIVLIVKDRIDYAGFKIYDEKEFIVGWNIDYINDILFYGASRETAKIIARRLKIGRVV